MSAGANHFILRWREHAGKTQTEVAEEIGVERSYYSRIENGKRGYNQEFLEKLAKLYRCRPADLLSRDPAKDDDLWTIASALSADDRLKLTEIGRTLRTLAAG